jgi:DNA-binding NtrC family response regulator
VKVARSAAAPISSPPAATAQRHPVILVVDDDPAIRAAIELLLGDGPYSVTYKSGVTEAVEAIAAEAFDLVITDLRLGSDSGLDVIRRAKDADPGVPAILMTSFSSMDSAISALRLGASDYIIKPFNNEEFVHACERALEERKLRQENAVLRRALKKSLDRKTLIGEHPKILRLMEMIKRVAPTDANVLIRGESGTGKELVANALHFDSARADGPLVTVNCGAIPSELVESELFGHTKGAYTGAVGANEGLIREANHGTLFLDEIGELPLALQVKFLRVLEDKQIRPVGSREVYRVDVRIVAATNKDLKEAVARGEFREDLYYRLNVIDLHVPPLRERGHDVNLLAAHFVEQYSANIGKRVTGLDADFNDFIRSYDWPGNVRELKNLIERAVILADAEVLSYSDLSDGIVSPAFHADNFDEHENPLSIEGYIKQVVMQHQDKYSEVELANMLGIGRKALWMRRRRWGLPRQGKAELDGKPETKQDAKHDTKEPGGN